MTCERHQTFMLTRDQQDLLAWKIMDEVKPVPIDQARGGRPLNYQDFDRLLRDGVSFTWCWSSFLHAFIFHKDPEFLRFPAPTSLSPGWQALLAGTSEFLSDRYSLPMPPWVERPQYFLPEVWDPEEEDYGLDLSEFRADRLARSPEAFRRRNVCFLARNLTTI